MRRRGLGKLNLYYKGEMTTTTTTEAPVEKKNNKINESDERQQFADLKRALVQVEEVRRELQQQLGEARRPPSSVVTAQRALWFQAFELLRQNDQCASEVRTWIHCAAAELIGDDDDDDGDGDDPTSKQEAQLSDRTRDALRALRDAQAALQEMKPASALPESMLFGTR